MTPQNSEGFRVITSGPGTMPWMVIAPTMSAMTALGGMPRERSGMNEVCAPALFADSGPGHPLDGPAPEAPRVPRELLLQRVGRERPEHRAVAGQDPQRSAPRRLPRSDRGGRLAELLARWAGRRPIGAAPRRAARSTSRFRSTSAKPKTPIARTAKSMPSDERRAAEGHPLGAGLEVGAHRGEEQAEQDHRDRLRDRPAGQHHRERQPRDHQREVLGGPEQQRHAGERRRQRRDHQRRHAPGEERPDGGDRPAPRRRAPASPSRGRRGW